MGAQVEVPGLTVRSCDFTWPAGGMGSHTFQGTFQLSHLMSLSFPPLLKHEKQATKVHSHLSHSTMLLRPGSG